MIRTYDNLRAGLKLSLEDAMAKYGDYTEAYNAICDIAIKTGINPMDIGA